MIFINTNRLFNFKVYFLVVFSGMISIKPPLQTAGVPARVVKPSRKLSRRVSPR